MSNISSGIFEDAEPLSSELIKHVEQQVVEEGKSFAYLDEDGKCCFSVPFGVDVLQSFAWNNAYQLTTDGSTLTKSVYRKTGHNTYYLDKILQKKNIDDTWEEVEHKEHIDSDLDNYCDICGQPMALAGLFDQEDNLLASWDDLVNVYGMDVNKDYDSSSYTSDPTTPYYVLSNNEELSTGVNMRIGNVTKLGNYAFRKCFNLINIVLPDSLVSIGESAFDACYDLKSINLPNGITKITYGIFTNCNNLSSINIPNGVTSIESYAFAYCSGLNNITFDGTAEQWNSISKGTKWKQSVPATHVHCIDGDVAL